MKNVFIVIFTLMVLFEGLAQNNSNALDELYTPKVNSIFSESSSSGSSYTNGDYINAIKAPLFYMFRKRFALEYERRLDPSFSLIGGLGMNYGKDYFMILSSLADFSILENNGSGVDLGTILYDGKYDFNPNLFFNGGIRFYYDSWYTSHEGYLQLDYRFSHSDYKYSYSNSVYDNLTGNYVQYEGTSNVELNSSELNLISGTNFTTQSGSILFVHNIYWGGGIRATRYTQLVPGTNNLYKAASDPSSFYSFMLVMGYSLGVGW